MPRKIVVSTMQKGVNEVKGALRITSIQFNYWSSGPFDVSEIVAEKVSVYRKGRIEQKLYDGISKEPRQTIEYPLDKRDAETFFTTLEKDIKVHDWDADYSVFVCDGWTWNCKIRFTDRTVKTIAGTVSAPPGGEKVARMVRGLAEFKHGPLIFGLIKD